MLVRVTNNETDNNQNLYSMTQLHTIHAQILTVEIEIKVRCRDTGSVQRF